MLIKQRSCGRSRRVQPELPPPPPRSPERVSVEIAVRLVLLGLFTWVAWTLVSPFVPVLLWSAVLTVAFYPLFEWLRDRLGGRSWLAAVVLTLTGLAVTVGPATVLVTSLIHTVEMVGRHAGTPPYDLPPLPRELAELPVVGPHIVATWNMASSNIEALFTRYGHLLIGPGEWALRVAAGLAGSVITLLAAMVVSGFLYVPAPKLNAAVRSFADHVIGRHGADFVHLAGTTIRSVARGVIGVALTQALLIGAGLIVTDVPAAGLLTLASLVLCIVQIGALPIVVPILIWAWLVRDTGQALLLTAWLIPAALSDNLTKPLLMAKGLTTPLVVILAGVVGGTLAYGLTGLFLGPVVLAVFYDLVRFWLATPSGEGGSSR
jgi:predicted PurR-regulated permease PerM